MTSDRDVTTWLAVVTVFLVTVFLVTDYLVTGFLVTDYLVVGFCVYWPFPALIFPNFVVNL